MPAVIIRYQIDLKTQDGRRIEARIDPEQKTSTRIPVRERGSYSGLFDFLLIEDVFGFFQYQRAIRADAGPRLIATIESRVPIETKEALASGTIHRESAVLRNTDDFTENKPYQPGDDPRRINWKLFSHVGELFIREIEKEPPPRAKFAIVVDGSVDPRLFAFDEGRKGIDILCAYALGLALRLLERGFEVHFGANGRPAVSGNSAAAARCFGEVASFPMADAPALSAIEDPGTRIILFALPRLFNEEAEIAGPSLNHFIRGRSPISPPIEILFFYPGEADIPIAKRNVVERMVFQEPNKKRVGFSRKDKMREAGHLCVSFFLKQGGVDARLLET